MVVDAVCAEPLLVLAIPHSSVFYREISRKAGYFAGFLLCGQIQSSLNQLSQPVLQIWAFQFPTQPSREFAGKDDWFVGGHQVSSLLFGSEFTKPIGRRYTTIHKEVASSNKCSLGPHEESSNITHLVRGARSPSSGQLDHVSIPCATWSV